VTAVSHASSLSKRKEKEKENKIPIKSENKRKENKYCSCPKHPITVGIDHEVLVYKVDNPVQSSLLSSFV